MSIDLSYYRNNPGYQAEYNRVKSTGYRGSYEQWLAEHLATSPGEVDGAGVTSEPMDPALKKQLLDYFNGNEAFVNEHARVKASGDSRSPEEWLYDHLKSNPNDASAFLAATNQTEDQTGTETTAPLEQDLLERALNDYIYPDLDADKGRRATGQGILDRYNAAIDAAINQNRSALDGTRLQDEYDMADDVGSRFRDAVNAEATGQGTALDDLNQRRLDALAPLAAERISAADTQVSGINQALGEERDRIEAADAMSGFIGGSSMKDSTLARAAYGARQNAAETMGAAKVLNAGDTRSIWDDTAKGKAGTEFNRLAGISGADKQVATDRKSYFDNDFTRRLQSALVPASLEANRFQVMGAADDYAQSGLGRALNTLNWWSATPTQPNYSTFQQTASNAGNDLASLGAGLTSAGLNYGMANMKKSTTTPKTSTPTAADWNPFGVYSKN